MPKFSGPVLQKVHFAPSSGRIQCNVRNRLCKRSALDPASQEYYISGSYICQGIGSKIIIIEFIMLAILKIWQQKEPATIRIFLSRLIRYWFDFFYVLFGDFCFEVIFFFLYKIYTRNSAHYLFTMKCRNLHACLRGKSWQKLSSFLWL